jgi:hypothetical protein
VRAGEIADLAIAANPEKSNVALAKELGISDETVRRARSTNVEPEGRVVGIDGKSYPARRPKSEDQLRERVREAVEADKFRDNYSIASECGCTD